MSTGVSPLGPGSTVGGYELLEVIGKGGMGTVYKGRSPAGEIVAVKILATHLTSHDVLRTRFYLEAKLAMSLVHPNIVRAIEVGEDNGHHYLVMEFVDGESLNKRLQRTGPLSESQAVRVTIAIARALDKAHREGLVHRDVKPDNILIDSSGLAKLTDLGLAKKAEIDLDLTRTGKGLGTPHFMAPEQFRDAKNVDARSDIYALGATLYVLVTGKLPFRGEGPLDTFMKKSKNIFTPVEELAPGLSARTRQVITTSMSADPEQRPSTAAAVADYLENRLDQLPIGQKGKEAAGLETMWFVTFEAPGTGRSKIRGPESTIRAYIQRGKIPADAMASQNKRGPFLPIRELPEFRDACQRAALIGAGGAATISGAFSSPLVQSVTSRPFMGLDLSVFWLTLGAGAVLLGILAWYLLVF